MKELQTRSYDFELPEGLIASHPVTPRESSRLMVYNRHTGTITHTHFYNIQDFIPQDAAIIFNDTKVIKARLYGHKPSGGKVELLINKPLEAFLVNGYIRGKVRVGMELHFDAGLTATVQELCDDGSRNVALSHHGQPIRFEDALPIIDAIGHLPLPHYMQREDNAEDDINYQTVFARHQGAVAAPTASLHFSDALFQQVCDAHAHAFVTLHVGAGTFKPVESEIITDHPMHSEYYNISDDAIDLIEGEHPLLCVGTTSTRTVEYYARTHTPAGEANLFLHPNNPPQRVNHLLTNFHLPQSTLLMLVASFVGLETTHKLYQEAIKEQYRFYSYGDAMLIL